MLRPPAVLLLFTLGAAGCARGGQQAPVAADPIRVEEDTPSEDSIGAVPESGGTSELDGPSGELDDDGEGDDIDDEAGGPDPDDGAGDEAGPADDSGGGDIEIDIDSE